MPGSHGGGGSHGSFSSSSHSTGSSSGSSYSRTYFPGAYRYHYINRYGSHCYFYSSLTPRRMNLFEALFGPILFMIFPLLFVVVFAFSTIPVKLDTNKSDSYQYVVDNADIIDETSNIYTICDSIYDKTGIPLFIYTETKTELISEGFAFSALGIEDRAYSLYKDYFKENENYYMIYFCQYTPTDYRWCDMAGDSTNTIINDLLFDDFRDTFDDSLENNVNNKQVSFEYALDFLDEKVMTSEYIDYTELIITGVMGVIFFLVGLGTLRLMLKQYRDMKDYCDYRDKQNHGKDDIVKEDFKEEKEIQPNDEKDYLKRHKKDEPDDSGDYIA